MTPTLEDLSEPAPPPGWRDWNDEGVLVLEKVLDEDLMTAYELEWCRENGWTVDQMMSAWLGDDGHERCDAARPGGWPYCSPHMDNPALLALATSPVLADTLESLVREACALNLCLTGWTSTRRDWHQDGYLNRSSVGDKYAAVWMALGRVDETQGPFQYVPGSHRWHRLTMAKVLAALGEDGSDGDWPWRSEALLTPLVEERIRETGAEVRTFLPDRGDVLVWHPRLYHRGSEPAVQDCFRPALICHYSGVTARPDFPVPMQAEGGGWYFPIDDKEDTK